MKQKGRVIATCMTLLLSLTLCVPGAAYTGTVQTADAAETSGTTEDGLSYTIDTENKCATITDCVEDATEIVIPAEIDGYPVTSIGNKTFYNCTSLASIAMPDGVTSIGNKAFYNCISLASVAIPNEVTSIGKSAFYNCSSLTSVAMPDGVASIGNNAFYNCSSLTNVSIPDSITSVGSNAFYCTGYYFNDANWQDGVLYLDGWLLGADRDEVSKSYTIVEGTKGIAIGAFHACFTRREEPLDINPGHASTTSIATGVCDRLTSITIPNSVTEIGKDAFTGCYRLTIRCYSNSTAYQYAIENEIPVSLLDEQTTVYGDLDGNNSVDASDALTVLRAVVKLTDFSDTQTTAADVNGDGKVEAADALLILQKVVKLIDAFPVESAGK